MSCVSTACRIQTAVQFVVRDVASPLAFLLWHKEANRIPQPHEKDVRCDVIQYIHALGCGRCVSGFIVCGPGPHTASLGDAKRFARFDPSVLREAVSCMHTASCSVFVNCIIL